MSSYWELVTYASEEMCLQNPTRRFVQEDYDIMCNVLESELMKPGIALFPCTESRVILKVCLMHYKLTIHFAVAFSF